MLKINCKLSILFFFFLQGHTIALQYDQLLGAGGKDSSDSTAGTSADQGASTSGSQQPRIHDAIHKAAAEAYRKLLRTALELAKAGQPLASFKTMVKVQKANGVKLIKNMDGSKACGKFVEVLSDVIREKLAVILSSATAFSILTDGSQPKKTGSEKELILIRLERGGLPVYYVLSLADMDAYGDATAENLKTAIDEAFTKLQIPQER